MENNLTNRIYKAKNDDLNANHWESVGGELTESEKYAYADMIGSACRRNTKETINRLVQRPLALWSNFGIYNRVTFDPSNSKYPVDYCTGQYWPAERKTLRECLLGKYG